MIGRRYTPLHYAAEKGHAAVEGNYDVVLLLVANGADVTARNKEGSVEHSRRRCTVWVRTPFGLAARALGPAYNWGFYFGKPVRTAIGSCDGAADSVASQQRSLCIGRALYCALEQSRYSRTTTVTLRAVGCAGTVRETWRKTRVRSTQQSRCVGRCRMIGTCAEDAASNTGNCVVQARSFMARIASLVEGGKLHDAARNGDLAAVKARPPASTVCGFGSFAVSSPSAAAAADSRLGLGPIIRHREGHEWVRSCVHLPIVAQQHAQCKVCPRKSHLPASKEYIEIFSDTSVDTSVHKQA
jgi:hypothetical protein